MCAVYIKRSMRVKRCAARTFLDHTFSSLCGTGNLVSKRLFVLWFSDRQNFSPFICRVVFVRFSFTSPSFFSVYFFPIRMTEWSAKAVFDVTQHWVHFQLSVFRPSATVSRIGLMESCTCHCHWCGGPPWLADPPPHDG